MNVIATDRFVGQRAPARPRAPNGGERPQLRILLSSAGRRVGLLRAFRSSASALGGPSGDVRLRSEPGVELRLHGGGLCLRVPPVTSPDFIEAMLGYCERHGIALVIPTIDTELIAYSHAHDRFAAIGTTVSIGSPTLVDMARDKLATARFLAGAGIPSPRTASAAELLAGSERWAWPLLAKPRHGSSSRGIHVVRDRADVGQLCVGEDYVVQEMLRGREFTVNMFFDDRGQLGCAVPHERLKVRAGEVEKGVTDRHAVLCGLARDFARSVEGAFGAMCFQAIVDEAGEASLFEINARFGGGYPLAHHAGGHLRPLADRTGCCCCRAPSTTIGRRGW